MRNIILLVLFVLSGFNVVGQQRNTDFDSVLARKLGADDYGMKNYILVILKTGSNNLEAGAERDSLFRGHMDNIKRLADEGKLIVAGPMGKNDRTYRGIFILNVKTVDEARILLNSDPTVREKIFDTEFFEWYGSAALGEYLDASGKVGKYKF